MAKSV